MNIGQLKLSDFGRGLVIFVFSAVLTALLQMLNNGFGAIDYKSLLLIAATSGISYLLKNFFTDKESGKFLGRV